MGDGLTYIPNNVLTRMSLIDWLVENNETGVMVGGEFVQVYELSDGQLLQFIDEVRDEKTESLQQLRRRSCAV